MKIKYYLINLALITVLILTYVFYQNIDSKNEGDKTYSIRYKGNLIPTDKPISTEAYHYVYFDDIKYIDKEAEADALKAQGPIDWTLTFAGNTYSGKLKIVKSNETSVTYDGYLKMEYGKFK